MRTKNKSKKNTVPSSNVPIISSPSVSSGISSNIPSRNARLDSLMDRFWDWDPFSGSSLFSERPFERLGLVDRDANRLFISPRSDFWENEKEVGLSVDVPGVDRKDIQLNITPTAIEIRAEKNHEREQKRKDMYRMERSYSGFYRSFPLPSNVESSKAHARYENGVLKIIVPKSKNGLSNRRSVKVD